MCSCASHSTALAPGRAPSAHRALRQLGQPPPTAKPPAPGSHGTHSLAKGAVRAAVYAAPPAPQPRPPLGRRHKSGGISAVAPQVLGSGHAVHPGLYESPGPQAPGPSQPLARLGTWKKATTTPGVLELPDSSAKRLVLVARKDRSNAQPDSHEKRA